MEIVWSSDCLLLQPRFSIPDAVFPLSWWNDPLKLQARMNLFFLEYFLARKKEVAKNVVCPSNLQILGCVRNPKPFTFLHWLFHHCHLCILAERCHQTSLEAACFPPLGCWTCAQLTHPWHRTLDTSYLPVQHWSNQECLHDQKHLTPLFLPTCLTFYLFFSHCTRMKHPQLFKGLWA